MNEKGVAVLLETNNKDEALKFQLSLTDGLTRLTANVTSFLAVYFRADELNALKGKKNEEG